MVREAGQVNRPEVGVNEPRSSEEAQREVERTRSRMSDTLGALEQKVEPRRLVDQAIEALKSAGSQSQVLEILRNNPIPTALIAAGASWLVISSIREERAGSYSASRPSAGQSTFGGIRQSISDTLQAGKEKVSQLASSASETVSQTAQSVSGKASEMMGSAKESVSSVAGSVREKAAGMTEGIRSHSEQMLPSRGFWDIFEEHPLATAAGFVAAGVLAGLVIPVSRREEEMLGETAERLVDSARETGQQALQQATSTVSEKVGNVARSAADAATERMHGDEPLLDKVKGMAKDAAETAKEQMRKEGFMKEEHEEFRAEGSEGVRSASGTVREPSAQPEDSLDFPVEGRGASVPDEFLGDRPADAMNEPAKSTPEQPGDQIGDFTTDRPEGKGKNKDKGKQK